jgi:1-phosphofructokinase
VAAQLEIDSDTYITYTGRNPSGISTSDAITFLKKLQDRGAKIILDSKSFNLEQILAVRPWLIKPNQEEISELMGCEINSFEE